MRAHLIQSGRDFSSTIRAHSEIFSSTNMENYCLFHPPLGFQERSSSTNRVQEGISTSTIRFPVGNILIHKYGKLLLVSSTLGFSGWFPHPTIGFRVEYPYPPIGPQEAFSSMNKVFIYSKAFRRD